jgi:peptidyl-tRNA hydrolase, PTH2 family
MSFMYKMVFVINKSLKMSSGKTASQTAHAAVSLYIKAIQSSKSPEILAWVMLGQPKIILKSTDDTSILEIQQKALSSDILSVVIHDAGRTQIKAGSLTCLALFGPTSHLDKITGGLSLL